MPTTTNYGWTTPADTDLVKDGASAIRTLGSSIDSTLKTQIDAQIPDSLLTTKGDLIAATGASTPARLAVGTNGQVLQADSTAATGLKWSSSSNSPSMLGIETSGNYAKTGTTGTAGTITPVEDTTYYSPIYLPTATFDRISCATGAGFSGTATVRLGLYNASTTTGKPDTVVFDAGTVSCTAASTTYEITISQSITAGWYWFAFNSQTNATTNLFTNYAAGMLNGIIMTGSNFTNSNTLGYSSESGITGAFATAGTLTQSTTGVLTGMRYA